MCPTLGGERRLLKHAGAPVRHAHQAPEPGEKLPTHAEMLAAEVFGGGGAGEPHMAELDTLASQIRDRIFPLVARANRLVEDLGPAGQKYFDDPEFRSMKMSPIADKEK